MKKRLLVLGIGPAQVDLIEIAKEMGMEVFACAFNSKGPGLSLVDDFREIDIKDIDGVKDYAIEQDVDVIYSMALESGIATISKVSEMLNLPTFCSLETLNKLTNKGAWRKSLGDIEGNVKSISGNKLEDFKEWNCFPSVIKPVDGSGQRGVYKVNNFKDIESVFEQSISHSKIKELILEEYVDGPELSVNSLMYNGELKFSVISDRISYKEYPGGIIKEHHVPSRIIDKGTEDKINNLVKKVNHIMGLENGHIYFQLKLEENGPKLIEFTPRFDACHMWRLIYESTGLDLRKVVLEILVYGESETLSKYDFSTKQKSLKTKFISDKPGTIVNKSKYETPENEVYLEWYYDESEKVKHVTGYLEKVGYMIVQE